MIGYDSPRLQCCVIQQDLIQHNVIQRNTIRCKIIYYAIQYGTEQIFRFDVFGSYHADSKPHITLKSAI